MPEQTSTTTPDKVPQIPQNIDWKLAEERITQVQNHLKGFEGKQGHNPFLYYNKYIQPLVTKYMEGVRTPALFKEIMDLKLETPTTDKVPQAIGGIIGLPKPKESPIKPVG